MVEEKRLLNQARYAKYAEIRDLQGFSDAKVSSETGVLASTLSDWKKGEYTPSFGNMMKLASFLNVSLNEFEVDKKEGDTN